MLWRRAVLLKDRIVSRFGLGGGRAEMCGRSGPIALRQLRQSEVQAAPDESGAVADRVSELASFLRRCTPRSGHP